MVEIKPCKKEIIKVVGASKLDRVKPYVVHNRNRSRKINDGDVLVRLSTSVVWNATTQTLYDISELNNNIVFTETEQMVVIK